jgi:FAD:protein FMN transferase
MSETLGAVRRYRHRAMATLFEVVTAGEDDSFGAGAARAAFEEIDRLEQELSRFLPNSDVSRINNLQAGGSVNVSADTFECLRLCMQYHGETAGAFDVTTGALKDCWVGADRSPRVPAQGEITEARLRCGMSRLELDAATMTVRVRGPGILIDLGAIGKGFAVDRAAGLLREWGVGSALVHGGASSTYAFGDFPGHPGWPVTLSDPAQESRVIERVSLRNQGLGGSGVTHGRHIIDPRSGLPAESRRAAWVCSPDAARSDALSTACMILTREEIQSIVAGPGEVRAITIDEGSGEIVRFGCWGAA